jgi:hypothetical protein
MPQLLEQRQDETVDWQVTLRREDGTDPDYAGDEPFTATIWAGDDLASAASPTVTWITAPATVNVRVDTSAIGPGDYQLRVTDANNDVDVGWFRLRVLPAPGVATASPTYCSFDDLLTHAPWILDVQAESDQAGFAEQRARAREWLDSVLQAHYDPGSPGYSSADSLLVFGYWDPGAQGYSTWLRDQLDADNLVVDRRVKDCVAKYAISLVLQSNPTFKVGDYSAWDAADSYRRQAIAEVSTLVAGIDMDDDGDAEFWIDCNGVVARRG